MPALKVIQSSDQDLMFIQSNVKTVLDSLQSAPLIGGKVLSKLSLISGQDNLIAHNLGYAPRLSFAMLPNVQSDIWSPSSDATNINLHCSTSCVVNVWIT